MECVDKLKNWLASKLGAVALKLFLSGHFRMSSILARFAAEKLLGKEVHHHQWEPVLQDGFVNMRCKTCGRVIRGLAQETPEIERIFSSKDGK